MPMQNVRSDSLEYGNCTVVMVFVSESGRRKFELICTPLIFQFLLQTIGS